MTPSSTLNVAPVHGGLDAPVNRIDANAAADTSLARVEVNEVDQTSLYRIADGTLSPLTGPMGEIDYDNVRKIHGMDITVVTSTDKDDEGFALLRELGFPFRGAVPVQVGASA